METTSIKLAVDGVDVDQYSHEKEDSVPEVYFNAIAYGTVRPGNSQRADSGEQ